MRVASDNVNKERRAWREASGAVKGNGKFMGTMMREESERSREKMKAAEQ